jgi:hypothetical protein
MVLYLSRVFGVAFIALMVAYAIQRWRLQAAIDQMKADGRWPGKKPEFITCRLESNMRLPDVFTDDMREHMVGADLKTKALFYWCRRLQVAAASLFALMFIVTALFRASQ